MFFKECRYQPVWLVCFAIYSFWLLKLRPIRDLSNLSYEVSCFRLRSWKMKCLFKLVRKSAMKRLSCKVYILLYGRTTILCKVGLFANFENKQKNNKENRYFSFICPPATCLCQLPNELKFALKSTRIAKCITSLSLLSRSGRSHL